MRSAKEHRKYQTGIPREMEEERCFLQSCRKASGREILAGAIDDDLSQKRSGALKHHRRTGYGGGADAR